MKAVLQKRYAARFEQQAKTSGGIGKGNVVARYGSDKPDALRLMIFAHSNIYG
ncbi:hypothetical protein KCP73_25960 [Salmonella enterica subsp. enterica]|nr:hypothetical protein KCP73_25960 [Salmonella enterica subsp. enterica]